MPTSTNTAPRKSKKITKKEDIDYILSLTSEQCCERGTIIKLFGDFGDGPRFNPYDLIDIPAGQYGSDKKKNKNQFTTTVGIYVFNKGSIEPLFDVLGYINKTISASVYHNINETLSYARLEDKITMDQLKDFIIQSQIYMSCTAVLAPSHTMKLLMATNAIEGKKKELEKKYADAIKNADLKEIAKMEDELLQFSKEYLGDDPSVDMFDSGARSKWGNNFKNMYVMKGPVRLSDGSYDVVTSSYISGLDKEDIVKTNDSMVGGPYSRAVNTQNGGAKEKLFVNAFEHIKVLGPGTDCGTNRTIEITLTKKNIKEYMYCFIKEGSRLIEITSENKDKYIGKTVRLRYSSMCQAKNGICEKCAGTIFNRIGITNVGVATAQFMSALKNASMKAFHDSTLRMSEIDVEKTFGYK